MMKGIKALNNATYLSQKSSNLSKNNLIHVIKSNKYLSVAHLYEQSNDQNIWSQKQVNDMQMESTVNTELSIFILTF